MKQGPQQENLGDVGGLQPDTAEAAVLAEAACAKAPTNCMSDSPAPSLVSTTPAASRELLLLKPALLLSRSAHCW